VIPFHVSLRDRILEEGPITVERYMGLCIQHYYATRDPLGAAGDFTTAPEISQMFGELIGLWAVATWHSMGSPSALGMIELGPGRGTLMVDALRAGRVAPDFLGALSVHCVETSPVLRDIQRAALGHAGVPVTWHDSVDEVPAGPVIVVANEFFDALPTRQFVATERGWCERLVGLDGETLAFGLKPEPEESLGRPPRISDILEHPAAAIDLTRAIAERIASSGGAALSIDYGYWGPAFGDTLQAVRGHAFVPCLSDPGNADLTAHVDFRRLAQAGAAENLRVHGPIEQRAFLQALGIEGRAERLKRRATPAQAADIDSAVARLTGTGPDEMGGLFKVLGLSHPDLEALPGLPSNPSFAKT
jgi:NADH dehydrogenase [ubiquinone] 1 alpha subcomplex assembly factor 7